MRTLYPIPLHLYYHPYKILINPILPFLSFIFLHIYFSVLLSTFPNSEFTPTNSNLWKKIPETLKNNYGCEEFL